MAGRTEFLETIRHRTQAGRYKPTHAPALVQLVSELYTRHSKGRGSAATGAPQAG